MKYLTLFLFVFAALALAGPGRIDIVDGQTRYAVACSLADHGDSIIRDSKCWFAVYKGRDGDTYTDYRLPQSALGAVAVLMADDWGCDREFFFSLISPAATAFLAVLFYIRLQSVWWALAGIFCTPCFYYGTSTFDDMLGTVGVVLAVISPCPHISGLSLAWAINCKPPLIFFALPCLRKSFRHNAVIIAYVVGGCIFGAAYQYYKFPGIDTTAEYERIWGPIWGSPLVGLSSLLLSLSCGVLFYSPSLFLSYRGCCKARPSSLLVASALFVLFVSSLTFYKGEPSWGPRYLTPVFALLFLYAPLSENRCKKFILALGLIIQLMALTVDPQRLFSYAPLGDTYYLDNPWGVFDPKCSHLLHRPREIAEVYCMEEKPPHPLVVEESERIGWDMEELHARYHQLNSPRPWLARALWGTWRYSQ